MDRLEYVEKAEKVVKALDKTGDKWTIKRGHWGCCGSESLNVEPPKGGFTILNVHKVLKAVSKIREPKAAVRIYVHEGVPVLVLYKEC